MEKIDWNEIDWNEFATNHYIDRMILNKDLLTKKFIVQKYNTTKGKASDITLEDVYIKNVNSTLENLLENNKFVVFENYDGIAGIEDPPTIVINNKTNFYPVDIINYN